MNTYACYIRDDRIRKKSSSGGIFYQLSSHILNLSGVVYGVTMSKDCYFAEFIRVETMEDLPLLMGSKYIQARIKDTYKKVKIDLENNKMVLFSGTGCQINGLKCFLQREYENLLCVDIVCHGVPSEKLWKNYVSYLEKKHGKLEAINFRYKENSTIKKNQMFVSKNEDPFMRMFLRDYCLRPSCYQCVIKDNKMSDITIADFWGIGDIVPEMNDGKGVSLVIARNTKGDSVFHSVEKDCVIKKVKYEDGIKRNPAEYQSAVRPSERNDFFKNLDELSTEEIINQYASDIPISLLGKIKQVIKKLFMIKSNSLNYGVLYNFRKDCED